MPKVVACGSREHAFKDFQNALKNQKHGLALLLVDSEGPVSKNISSWTHLQNQNGWERPAEVTDERAHLMVQCMEAWFLADREKLATFFGRGFNREVLPR